MNCDRALELVPLDVYGDLDAAESIDLKQHLERCPGCCLEREQLLATRRLLNAAGTPEVSVDVGRIERESVAQQFRSLRRWKRTAFAVGALAAALLLVLLIRPTVQFGDGQLVVRWSDSPLPVQQPSAVAQAQPQRPDDLEERVRLLNDLVRAMREDAETSDRDRKEQIDLLVARLDVLRLQSQQRWDNTRHDVQALYTAQFGKKTQGVGE